jgi:hypothetical protein
MEHANMDLKTFIAETLKQVIDGVRDAQAHAKDTGALINAAKKVTTLSTGQVRETDDPERLQNVEFDVAVSAEEGKQRKGGLGIVVGPVAIGGHGQASTTTQSVSRVKFAVPLRLPVQKRE